MNAPLHWRSMTLLPRGPDHPRPTGTAPDRHRRERDDAGMKLDTSDTITRPADPAASHASDPDGGFRGRARRVGGSLSGARRYSRFVRLMKLILPSVAVVVLGLVMAWPNILSQAERLSVGLTRLDPGDANPRSLINPRYHGVDTDDQPYTLVAAAAVERADDPGRVDLEQPQGDIQLNEGRWLAVRGNQGVYSRDDRTLDLSGDVMLYRDDGFEFHTQAAHVDLGQTRAHGSEPVQGAGPGATIESVGFRLLDGGRVVVFTGEAHLILTDGGGGIAP